MKNYILFALIVLIDQLTKFFAINMNFGVINKTASLGFMQLSNSVIAVISIVVLVCLIIVFGKISIKFNVLFLLIITGGASNMIDRVLRGGVVDFIKIWKFPVFNFADLLICFAIFLLVVKVVKTNDKKIFS